jgi:N-dimethylarginine dimethylaminohydrolase
VQIMNKYKSVLLCPPDYFSVDYEINEWMDVKVKPNKANAMKQFASLEKAFEEAGVKVEKIQPQKHWPDLVFTANAGFIYDKNKILISSFAKPERQGEAKFFKKWFEERNWEVNQLSVPFEGQAEVCFWDDKLLSAYGFRANEETAKNLQKYVDREIITLELIDPHFYHLDMCLSASYNKKLISYYPKAFTQDSVKKIRKLKNVELLEVSFEDAYAYGCNKVPLKKFEIVSTGVKQLSENLRAKGQRVIEVEMGEFRKAGGGPRCLTFDLWYAGDS